MYTSQLSTFCRVVTRYALCSLFQMLRMIKVWICLLAICAASTSQAADSTQAECPVCYKSYGEVSDLNPTVRARGIPIPCGHRLCSDCLPRLEPSRCPVCRTGFELVQGEVGTHSRIQRVAPPAAPSALREDVAFLRRLLRMMRPFVFTTLVLRRSFALCLRLDMASTVIDGLLLHLERSL